MKTVLLTLISSGVLAGLVNYFTIFKNLPLPQDVAIPSSLEESRSRLSVFLNKLWSFIQQHWQIVGYIVIGIAGAFLVPLLHGVTKGLAGLEISKILPSPPDKVDDWQILILFGYGLVFGVFSIQIMKKFVGEFLSKIANVETLLKNAEHRLSDEKNKTTQLLPKNVILDNEIKANSLQETLLEHTIKKEENVLNTPLETKKYIIRIKENTKIEDILPATSFGFESIDREIKYKRLHSITDKISSINRNNLNENIIKPFSILNKEEEETIFENELLPNMNEVEKRLYRTYTVDLPTNINLETLKRQDGVEYIQENEINVLYFTPNDPLTLNMYNLKKIGCEEAWDLSGDNEVIVAVVDTGIDYNHPDIKNNMWVNLGFNFSEGNSDPKDFHGHGTHVAGTIAAVQNNFIGISGVAKNVKIMALKIFPNAVDEVCASAIKYAVDNGAKVINNSWGPQNRRPVNNAVADAINYAISKNVVVIFAAGNSNDDTLFYAPANHPDIICVSATDSLDNKADFSNFGNNVTIAAPGVNILSLKLNTDEYTIKDGTSMAAPHVAGASALLISKNNNLNPQMIKTILSTTSDSFFSTQPMGSGRLNIGRAMRLL